ncbi:hydrogenase expression/formation protein HypE [Helicobacter mustelae]|uniref:Hydrogenase isoenzymes formation protein n=1 Tax=Helicobacter mustelae (strain ATCC 43772 / CCUG 25715 / CIP 103759 / LMG 18044 / NCTC 12198 / R85-136P) TaxID=679897 RepID=D3UHC8_HELM1|nr:hydrogenase expression/formation protein HypE [Helicobacter mustelae]CBG39900.1 hydrogenase isoenzymes formation protein [Helicobacter mustelae 12198]SQH71411.1 hydrogenase isoenzymes formation protein [Helicobacter mustelae]STP12539.1 hydrogenase isoenzymes formation protein [Helicobacter mustelae]
MQTIQLSHGSGGAQTNELIERVFQKYLREFLCDVGEDAGVFGAASECKYATSTDSYVISPLFFSGGDIGKLSICGSSNDVAMRGAKPKYFNIGFILEEGLEIGVLEGILASMAKELKKTDLKILSADTKVVGRGHVDKIFVNTTAIGEVIRDVGIKQLREGDVILLSGGIGAHHGVIFCARNEISLHSSLQSDCKQLYPLLEPLFRSEIPLHTLRDATRGGIASVLNEWAQSADLDILIEEEKIPICQEVQGICEMLGLDVYALANEGACVLAVPKDFAMQALDLLRRHEDGKDASIIGEVRAKSGSIARVVLQNAWGSKRFLDYPQGELLPRIC